MKEEDHIGVVGKGKGAGIPIHNAGDGSTQQDSLGREAGKAFLCDSSHSRSAGEPPPTERRNRDSGLRSGPGKPCLTNLGPGKDLVSPGLASGYRLPPLGVDAEADIEMPDASREAG
ncbi:hypothetical protein K3495_g16733 [Podosphaera aphanis]|nr:hypothetical protein K3495_g16733 [Podosphaera aphanis]